MHERAPTEQRERDSVKSLCKNKGKSFGVKMKIECEGQPIICMQTRVATISAQFWNYFFILPWVEFEPGTFWGILLSHLVGYNLIFWNALRKFQAKLTTEKNYFLKSMNHNCFLWSAEKCNGIKILSYWSKKPKAICKACQFLQIIIYFFCEVFNQVVSIGLFWFCFLMRFSFFLWKKLIGMPGRSGLVGELKQKL